MNELNKVKHVGYNANTGAVNYEEDTLSFNAGDKNTSFIHLRGAMDNAIKAQLKIKTPNGEVVQLSSEVITNNRNVCREFAVIVDEPGIYSCQLVLSYKYKVNVSDIFKYQVKPSL